MPEETFDVVVVGARCAGSATARLLAQSGLRVLVLDRAAFPSDTLSTHGVGAVGVLLLRRWGLLDKVLATNVPWETSVGLKLGDVEMEREIPPGMVAPFCPRRVVLDNILVQGAREAGAEVRERAASRELITEDGAVVGIRYSDRDDRVHDVRARLVIGADGRNSFVAKAVNAPVYDVRPSKVGFRYAYYSGIPIKRVEMAWVYPNFAYVFPTNDGLACMAGATADATFDGYTTEDDQALVNLFEAASPRLAEVLRGGRRESRFYSHRGKDGRFFVPYGPGWALVGDAGYFRDPVIGQGISDALAGAQLLADAVLEGFHDPAALEQSLMQFQRQRDEAAINTYEASQQLASLDWTNEELPGLFARLQDSPARLAALLNLTQPAHAS
jgi:flavin-dependent dehydrogenase